MFRRCINTIVCFDEFKDAKVCMINLQKIKIRTENLVESNFENPVTTINELFDSLSADVRKGIDIAVEKRRSFMKLIQEQKIVEYFCGCCMLILKEAQADFYPGINDPQRTIFVNIISFLTNVLDAFAVASGIISHQTGLIKEINSKLLHWHRNIAHDKLEEHSEWITSLITLLHNVAMYDDNLTRIKSEDTISVVRPYLHFKINIIRLLSLATIADLIDESESDIIQSESDVIEFLMESVLNALDSGQSMTDDGLWVDELTRIIHQIAKNDNNIRMLVNHGAIPLLVRVCDRSNVKEQAEAVKAIWRLAFNKENKGEMLETTEWDVVGLLKRLSRSSDANVKMISNKALWTIKDKQEKRRKAQHKKEHKKGQHVMISYNWGHQSIAKQIRDCLMRRGIKVWMDLDNMSGSTIEAMANAVEQAFVVLMCYSNNYKNSDACRAGTLYNTCIV